MTDNQIVMLVFSCVALFFYVVANIISTSNIELYKKKYNELERNVYRYEPNFGHSFYFYFYNYDINTVTFFKTNVTIIFFLDGDIKLTDNVYIHKNHLWMSLVSWYWYRKFHKLKDYLVRQYSDRQIYNRSCDNNQHERYMEQNNSTFKFFRG